VRIASSPRLRFSPLEIFPQRQFQPVLPRIPGGLAFAFVLVVRHREPVGPGSVRTSNRPMTAAAATLRSLPATMASLRGLDKKSRKQPHAMMEQTSAGSTLRRNREPNRPATGQLRFAMAIPRWFRPFLRVSQAPPALAHAGGLWQGSARSAGPLGPILVSGACCRSSVVEHSIGNGEVDSSILSGSTSFSRADPANCAAAAQALPPSASNPAIVKISFSAGHDHRWLRKGRDDAVPAARYSCTA
jgi:hypothetical protein